MQSSSQASGSIRQRHSLSEAFSALRQAGRIGLMPFIPAGYPDLETTALGIAGLETGGATAIEVGFPFSDPIADGPIVQEAFTAALAKKLRMADVFCAIAEARANVSIPLVSMVSYSIVFRYGVERFVNDAKQAGFDGLILPDLPPPEAQRICETVRAGGLDTILLIAPMTTRQRREEIVRLCSGFIYYLSIAGITGERDQLPADVTDNLRQLRQITDLPLCVGFGISKPQHLQQLHGLADGAIVGSGVVRRMKTHLNDGPQQIAKSLTQYARELLGG